MTIEQFIQEMHEDFCRSKILPFAKKLEYLLEWAEGVGVHRAYIESIDPEKGTTGDYETALMHLGEHTFKNVAS